jgi:hypothetical protein
MYFYFIRSKRQLQSKVFFIAKLGTLMETLKMDNKDHRMVTSHISIVSYDHDVSFVKITSSFQFLPAFDRSQGDQMSL